MLLASSSTSFSTAAVFLFSRLQVPTMPVTSTVPITGAFMETPSRRWPGCRPASGMKRWILPWMLFFAKLSRLKLEIAIRPPWSFTRLWIPGKTHRVQKEIFFRGMCRGVSRIP